MRILMSIMVFHPVIGGTEQSAKELAAGLVRRGHHVEVLTLNRPGQPAHEVIDGVSVSRSLRGMGRGICFVVTYAASLAWGLLRRRKQVDVVQVYFAYLDGAVASILRPWLPAKIVVRCGGGGPAGDVARLRRLKIAWLFLPLIRRLDRCVVVSRQMRQELLEACFDPARIVLIPNGVDTTRFAPPAPADSGRAGPPEPAAGESWRDGARPTMVTVGRLSQEKGIHILLDAWRRLLAGMPTARLVIVGDGPQRAALEGMAQTLGCNSTVSFAGERSDVPAYLQAADMFVLPSLSEGMSNALLEAMAAGLPCVATAVGAVPDVIQDAVNGRLVPPGDPQRLAQAMRALVERPDEARRLGRAARLTVETRHSLDQMVEGYVTVYQELLNADVRNRR